MVVTAVSRRMALEPGFAGTIPLDPREVAVWLPTAFPNGTAYYLNELDAPSG